MMGLNLGYALGLFAGSGTSTPTLQAAIATLGNDDPAVGYSVSYPFGVAGPILFLYFAFMILKPKIETRAGRRHGDARDRAAQPGALRQDAGRGDERPAAAGARSWRCAPAHHNQPAVARATSSRRTTSCWSSAPTKEALEQARKLLGEAAPGRVFKDRSDLDYLRVFASRPSVVGRAIGDLELPGNKAVVVAQVRRGDANILPRPDLVLEFGDRVGLLAHRDDFAALRKFFGDSIKGTAEFSYISIGLGMALGFLLGAIQLPLPGIGKLVDRPVGRADRGADPRQAAAHRRHELDHSAVGQPRAAQPRADAVPGAGRHVLGAEVRRHRDGDRPADAGPRRLVLIALVLPILILGLFVFRMPYDEVAGIVAGACGNPAILAYSNKLAPTDRPDIGYAMIFPGMTIVKILFVDIVPALFR